MKQSSEELEDIISSIMMEHGDRHVDGYKQIAKAVRTWIKENLPEEKVIDYPVYLNCTECGCSNDDGDKAFNEAINQTKQSLGVE